MSQQDLSCISCLDGELREFIKLAQQQQTIVNNICRGYEVQRLSEGGTKLLPVWNDKAHQYLMSHLWYDDSSSSLYCSLPKVASTTMNQYFLLLNGLVSEQNLSVARPPTSVLRTVKKLSDLHDLEQSHHLGTYYLFTTIRNPLERLVSGYRDKLERAQIPWYEGIQVEILERYRRRDYASWIERNKTYELRPTFRNFIQYFISNPSNLLDHHFRPYMDVCFPCIIRFNYYMHIGALDKDLTLIAKLMKWNISLNSLEHTVDHPDISTSQLMTTYYTQLPKSIKRLLRTKLQFELEFYYALHPEDRERDELLL